MTAKVKSVLSVTADALETAAGYALVAVGLFAAIFIDITGNGSLWSSTRELHAGAQEGLESPNATRIVKVPTVVSPEKVHEDRILAVFDPAPNDGMAAAVYQAPDASGKRPEAAFTDTPADPEAGKSWKRSLTGELRSFTVYGKGEQTSSATQAMSAPAPAPAYQAPAPAVVAAAGSAAGAPTAAVSRPGLGAHLSRGALSASDSTRNVR